MTSEYSKEWRRKYSKTKMHKNAQKASVAKRRADPVKKEEFDKKRRAYQKNPIYIAMRAKYRETEARKKYTKEYNQRPYVKLRKNEYMRKRRENKQFLIEERKRSAKYRENVAIKEMTSIKCKVKRLNNLEEYRKKGRESYRKHRQQQLEYSKRPEVKVRKKTSRDTPERKLERSVKFKLLSQTPKYKRKRKAYLKKNKDKRNATKRLWYEKNKERLHLKAKSPIEKAKKLVYKQSEKYKARRRELYHLNKNKNK